MDKVVSVVFPDVVPASGSLPRNDLSTKSSAPLEMTGLAIVYPKTHGNARLTLELAGQKIIDDVPFAAIGVAYDGDPSYASRPFRMSLPGPCSVAMHIQNPHATDLPAGSVSVVMYSHPRENRDR